MVGMRRVVTRIDLSLEHDRRIVGLAVHSMVSGVALMVDDPCPAKKTRKRVYMRIHFRQGGHRVIMRLPEEMLAKVKFPNMLFTWRI